jgi:hypothetical protein
MVGLYRLGELARSKGIEWLAQGRRPQLPSIDGVPAL